MPTPQYYVKQGHDLPADALPDMVRFLINDHPTITGPGWTIVEAQAGGNREVPSDSTDLDSLVSATGWPNGSLAVGDWIVLESANANNTNHFQLYIEYESTVAYSFKLIPLQDFATGGGAASPPTLPSTSVGTGTSLFAYSTFNHFANYTIIADEGMMMFLLDGSNAGLRFTYIGEVNVPDPVRDSRAYVIRDGETNVEHTNSGWDRLSPMDQITLLTGVPVMFGLVGTGIPLHDMNAGRMFDVDYILPVGVWFNSPGDDHDHFAGWLRYCFSGRMRSFGHVAITPDRRWFAVANGTSDPAIFIQWNGVNY